MKRAIRFLLPGFFLICFHSHAALGMGTESKDQTAHNLDLSGWLRDIQQVRRHHQFGQGSKNKAALEKRLRFLFKNGNIMAGLYLEFPATGSNKDERWAWLNRQHLIEERVAVAAREGLPAAQMALGRIYSLGLCHIPQSISEAAKWLRLAAEQGYAPAQNELGFLYENGEGEYLDQAEAAKWYRLAAEQGYPAAQSNLGSLLEKGQGVGRNQYEAYLWFRKAAEQNYPPAQNNLGYAHYSGEGVVRNRKEAAKWFRLAAEQGYSDAQSMLGYMYERGHGVKHDHLEAVKWYRLAAEQGHPGAIRILRSPEKHGHPEAKDKNRYLTSKIKIGGIIIAAIAMALIIFPLARSRTNRGRGQDFH